MTSDREDLRKADATTRSRVVDRSDVARLAETQVRNDPWQIVHRLEQHSILKAMQAIETPGLKQAREWAAKEHKLLDFAQNQNQLAVEALRQTSRLESFAAAALDKTLAGWPLSVSEAAKAAYDSITNIRAWQDHLGYDAARRAVQEAEETQNFIRRMGQHFTERMDLASQLTQTDSYRAWASLVTDERAREGIRRILEDSEETGLSAAVELDRGRSQGSEVVEVDPVSEAWLSSWIAWCLSAARVAGLNPSQRFEVFLMALHLACFIYSEASSGRDHAEIVALMQQQHQAQMAVWQAQDEKVARQLTLTEELRDLGVIENSYQVAVNVAPLRPVLRQKPTLMLHRADEVQVLKAAGKWRFIQTVDDDGMIIFGWVMNKHLERVKEKD